MYVSARISDFIMVVTAVAFVSWAVGLTTGALYSERGRSE